MKGFNKPSGHDGGKCGAKKRQGEGTCEKSAGWGTPHVGVGRCRLHGGNTRDHVNAGQRELARKAMDTYGLPIEINPVDALLQEVSRTAGHVAWLGERVKALTEAEAIWSTSSVVDKTATEFPGVDRTDSATAHAWIQLYQKERAHLVAVAKTAIAAGIAERQVKLAEAQGAMLAQVIRAVLDDLVLTPEQQARVPEIVPRHLRAIAA